MKNIICLLAASFFALMLPASSIANFIDNNNPPILSNTLSAELVDTDGDGLDDAVDLDDDNDGILDTDECPPPAGSSVATYVASFSGPTSTVSQGHYPPNAADAIFTSDPSGAAGAFGAGSTTPGGNWTTHLHEITVNTTQLEIIMTKTGSDQSMGFSLMHDPTGTATTFGQLTYVSFGATCMLASGGAGETWYNYGDIPGQEDCGSFETNNQVVSATFSGLTCGDTYYIGVWWVTAEDSYTISFNGTPDCAVCTQDTDGDGVIDPLDTDADGDGCPDAIEGGGTFMPTDLDAADMLTGGVDANGVPTVASGGQPVGASQNSADATACASLCTITDPSPVASTCVGNNDLQFSMNLTGTGIGTTYAVIGATPATGTYGTATTFTIVGGANGTNQTITVTDGTDPNCTLTITITGAAACAPPPPTCANVDLSILFDALPAETSWDITDASGSIVGSGGPYNLQSGGSTLSVAPAACLPDGCFTLNFYDTGGNGMCPTPGSTMSNNTFGTSGGGLSSGTLGGSLGAVARPCGNYQLYDANGVLLTSGGGNFGAAAANTFCLSGGLAPLWHEEDDSSYMRQSQSELLKVFPTLVKNHLSISYSLETIEPIQLNIVDINGQLIQQYVNNTSQMQLNVSDLSAGIYFVQIVTNSTILVERFVKQ